MFFIIKFQTGISVITNSPRSNLTTILEGAIIPSLDNSPTLYTSLLPFTVYSKATASTSLSANLRFSEIKPNCRSNLKSTPSIKRRAFSKTE